MEKLGFTGMIWSILLSVRKGMKQGCRRELELRQLRVFLHLLLLLSFNMRHFPLPSILSLPLFYVSPSHCNPASPIYPIHIKWSYISPMVFCNLLQTQKLIFPSEAKWPSGNKHDQRVSCPWYKYSCNHVDGGGKEINYKNG